MADSRQVKNREPLSGHIVSGERLSCGPQMSCWQTDCTAISFRKHVRTQKTAVFIRKQRLLWWTIQDLKFAVAVLSAVIRSQNVLISMGSGILFYYSVLPFFIWQQFIKAKNKAKNPSADILNIDR